MKALLLIYFDGHQEVFLVLGDSSKEELIKHLCGDSTNESDHIGNIHNIEEAQWIIITNQINLRDLSDLLLKEDGNGKHKE